MSDTFSEKILLTTPIYYTNGLPHLGHSYTTVVADFLKRYYTQKGLKALFLTGTDEHGEKITQSAEKEKISEKELVDRNSRAFQEAWKTMGLEPDIFYRTTQESHRKMVQKVLEQLKERELIYFSEYTGKYCVGCERFLTEAELNEKGECPDHLKAPEERQEGNYFFKMSAYQEQLLKHYEAHPGAILPHRYLKEVLSFLKEPLEDLSISRPKARVPWGIEIPFDPDHVVYVWFDALLNYLGAIGFDGDLENFSFDDVYWENSCHLIGKDILKTHAIYWPTMLMGMGIDVFKRLQVGGFWLVDNQKMSKSLGNVLDPMEINRLYGTELFRYYLLREMSYGADASFTTDSFITRVNADLANGFGNLCSRTLSLIHKRLDGTLPPKKAREEKDLELLKRVETLSERLQGFFDDCEYHKGLQVFSETVADCDRYVNEEKPWALAKDPAKRERLEAVLGTLADALWKFSILMHGVLPEGCGKLQKALGHRGNPVVNFSQVSSDLAEGQKLDEVPRLYPRIEAV